MTVRANCFLVDLCSLLVLETKIGSSRGTLAKLSAILVWSRRWASMSWIWRKDSRDILRGELVRYSTWLGWRSVDVLSVCVWFMGKKASLCSIVKRNFAEVCCVGNKHRQSVREWKCLHDSVEFGRTVFDDPNQLRHMIIGSFSGLERLPKGRDCYGGGPFYVRATSSCSLTHELRSLMIKILCEGSQWRPRVDQLSRDVIYFRSTQFWSSFMTSPLHGHFLIDRDGILQICRFSTQSHEKICVNWNMSGFTRVKPLSPILPNPQKKDVTSQLAYPTIYDVGSNMVRPAGRGEFAFASSTMYWKLLLRYLWLEKFESCRMLSFEESGFLFRKGGIQMVNNLVLKVAIELSAD